MNTDIRKHFNAPKAKFVCVTLGQPDIERPGASDVAIFEAKVGITSHPNPPKFEGTVATAYTPPPGMGDSSNGHRSNSSKSKIIVGWAMGDVMIKLIRRSRKAKTTNSSVLQKSLIGKCAAGLLASCA